MVRALIALLVIVGALELWLRSQAQSPPRAAVTSPSRRRVLCVGDSYTYGIGAPRGHAYPDHLGRLLGADWAVVNEGWPGANSSMMAERLPTWLAEARPDVVVVMAGMNNHHNPLGGTYRRLVNAGYSRPGPWATLTHTLDVALWRLRVYRLIRWSVADRLVRAPIAAAPAAPASSVGRPSGAHWNAGAAADRELTEVMERALRDIGRGEREGAVRSLRTAFGGVTSCERLSEPFINQLRELRSLLPSGDYASLTATLRARMPPADYATCVEGPFFLESDAELQQKMLWYDLDQMRVAAARAGAQLVILAYPWYFGTFQEVHARFAMTHRLPLISPQLPAWYSMTDLAAPNGRLSSEGNRWLASQIISQGRALGLFPATAP